MASHQAAGPAPAAAADLPLPAHSGGVRLAREFDAKTTLKAGAVLDSCSPRCSAEQVGWRAGGAGGRAGERGRPRLQDVAGAWLCAAAGALGAAGGAPREQHRPSLPQAPMVGAKQTRETYELRVSTSWQEGWQAQ